MPRGRAPSPHNKGIYDAMLAMQVDDTLIVTDITKNSIQQFRKYHMNCLLTEIRIISSPLVERKHYLLRIK